MSPSWEHERYGRFMGKLVPVVARAMGLPYLGGGGTTFRRPEREAGLEPDQCFYIRNAPRIQGKRRIDLRIDPPPDLAIEIEASRRMDRKDVYARLGVPELWRYDGHQLRVLRLGKGNRYRRARRSANFPRLPIDEMHDLMQKLWDVCEADWEDLATEWASRFAGKSSAGPR